MTMYLIVFAICYISAKKSDSPLVKIPKIITIIFGAPVGVGRMPIYQFMICISNLVAFILTIASSTIFGTIIAMKVYLYTFVTLGVLVTLFQGFIQKDFWW